MWNFRLLLHPEWNQSPSHHHKLLALRPAIALIAADEPLAVVVDLDEWAAAVEAGL
jgi:hypothetical protein